MKTGFGSCWTVRNNFVPLFQRFYVWDRLYWNTLWADVLELVADEDEDEQWT